MDTYADRPPFLRTAPRSRPATAPSCPATASSATPSSSSLEKHFSIVRRVTPARSRAVPVQGIDEELGLSASHHSRTPSAVNKADGGGTLRWTELCPPSSHDAGDFDGVEEIRVHLSSSTRSRASSRIAGSISSLTNSPSSPSAKPSPSPVRVGAAAESLPSSDTPQQSRQPLRRSLTSIRPLREAIFSTPRVPSSRPPTSSSGATSGPGLRFSRSQDLAAHNREASARGIFPPPGGDERRLRSATRTGATAAELPFNEHRMPTDDELRHAKACMTRAADGTYHAFGDLIHRRGPTVVIFIRHFWCGFCATYLSHLASFFDDKSNLAPRRRLNLANVKVVVIGNGSHKLISKYRELTGCPFDIFTDPTDKKQLYRALGMTLRTYDAGPNKDKGDYLGSRSLSKSYTSTLLHGIRLAKANPGDMKLLGGEFIFAPKTYEKETSLWPGPGQLEIGIVGAHRMRTTRDHGDVVDTFRAAGVDVRTSKSCIDE